LISTIEKTVQFFYFLGKLCSMPYANGVNFRAGTGVEITSGVRFGSLKSLAAFLASRKARFYNAASAARINLFIYFVSFFALLALAPGVAAGVLCANARMAEHQWGPAKTIDAPLLSQKSVRAMPPRKFICAARELL
jgi:uncharacterized membrane protein (UPF0136 family)